MPRRWYRILQDFMAESKRLWARRYPDFRSHNDGDKLAAYELVTGVVEIPKRYMKLHSVWSLTSEMLRRIEADAFVIKAILGNQGRRVICLHKKKINNIMMYRDILRQKLYQMNLHQTLSYIIHILKKDEATKGSALIIEEFLGDPERGLPQDYKLYTVNGKVRLISVFGRRGKDEYANSYDRHWRPIPMSKIYRHPEDLDYIEEAQPLDPLPSPRMRLKLIQTAEILAHQHRAIFCRYDFYCVKDKIYFGEITPVCGDLNNYRVLDDFAKRLCPDEDQANPQKVNLPGSQLS